MRGGSGGGDGGGGGGGGSGGGDGALLVQICPQCVAEAIQAGPGATADVSSVFSGENAIKPSPPPSRNQ